MFKSIYLTKAERAKSLSWDFFLKTLIIEQKLKSQDQPGKPNLSRSTCKMVKPNQTKPDIE